MSFIGLIRVFRPWFASQPKVALWQISFLGSLLLISCTCTQSQSTQPTTDLDQSIKTYSVNVVAQFPHDITAFTQGLLVKDGFFYESTGLRGASKLRKTEIASGQTLKELNIEDAYFAEGLAIFDGKLFQLTWQANKGFIYQESAEGFTRVSEFTYSTEGWGLTTNDSELIQSDGSSTLSFYDPADYSLKRTITVSRQGRPVSNLNELEMIDGKIYANVWQQDLIVIIDPYSGLVEAEITVDSAAILNGSGTLMPGDVLNGIAYDQSSEKLYITGKRWPLIFEVELVEN